MKDFSSMLYSFFLNLQKMLGVALPFGFATPTFIIEPKNHAEAAKAASAALYFAIA
jgi:hypothetical protein